MTRHELPVGMIRAPHVTGTHEGYMPGFGNDFETEALPGALPQGMNSPQKCNYGLYGEQLSGTAFTANPPERTWTYRIRPSVKHSARYTKIDLPYWKSAPCVDPDVISLGQYRWAFIDGLSRHSHAVRTDVPGIVAASRTRATGRMCASTVASSRSTHSRA